MIINSFFTKNGLPATGLSPTIKIWLINGATRTLVVNNQPMVEDVDGYYWYDFSSHVNSNDYVVLSDAGSAMAAHGRYSTAAITPASVAMPSTIIRDIIDGVWDEPAINHVVGGSTGEVLNQTKAVAESNNLALTSITALLQTLLKYERNRTRIDTTAKTLTVYDDDQVTPIRVFDLKDGAGQPSVTEVIERMPQ